MKRLNIILLVVLLIFGILATHGSVEAQDTEYVIGWSNASIGNPWRIEMVTRVEEELKNHPYVTMYITHAQDSAVKQISDCEDLLARGIDLLMLSPTSMDALNTIVDRAARMEIPCVVVQRETSNRDFTALVWNDDIQLGALAALETSRIIGHSGKVAIIEGFAGSPSALGRTKGSMDVIKLYPDIEVVASLPGDYQEAKARSVMEDILMTNPDLDAVIAQGGTMARGALSAIRAAGKAGEIKIITIGSENYVLKDIARGNMHSTVMETIGVGVEGFHKALKVLEGEGFRKLAPTMSPIVNEFNVEDWVRWDWEDDTWVY